MRIPDKKIRGKAQVMAALRRRNRELKMVGVARGARVSVQLVCDVTAGRVMPPPKLLAWLGFELAFVPRLAREEPGANGVPVEARLGPTPADVTI